jgi:DnaK suppressor protein
MRKQFLSNAQSLLESRRRLLRTLYRQTREHQLEVTDSLSGPMDLLDRAVREEETTLLHSLDGAEVAELRAVEQALQRLRDGSYGTCVGCGEAIAPSRLRALPEAAQCIRCATQNERPRRPASLT